DRVRLIQRALSVGFSLSELSKILAVRDKGGAPCRQVKFLLENKLSQIDQQMSELTVLRDHVKMVLADWEHRLSGTPDGNPAGLLEALTASAARSKNQLKGKRK